MNGPRVVADLGNSRIKWARIDHDGHSGPAAALPVRDPEACVPAWADAGLLGPAASWSIATVNPPAADRLAAILDTGGVGSIRWFRSAADVPVRHDLDHPATAGADRALAVLAALRRHGGLGPGLVAVCGTAATIERIDAGGTWRGGAITAGLGAMARGLNLATAQLPEVEAAAEPPAWGRSTRPALEAGIFWGVAGAIREILDRQSEGLGPTPWVIWAGGDAERLARAVGRPGSIVAADLVLEGLAALDRADRP